VGTNVYAPPEHNPLLHTGQLDSITTSLAQPNLTPAADIYSLAKTTYTLLAGEPPRRFSHRPITELPDSIRNRGWASSALRVLERATQNSPAARYQTVEEFWEEMAEAMLPPTQLLPTPSADVEEHALAGDQVTSVAARAVPVAPPRPRFDSARGLRHLEPNANGGLHPRIVVQLAEREKLHPSLPPVPPPPVHEIIASMPDASAQPVRKPASGKDWTASRTVRILVALLLIMAFAGMLLATHNYFRGRLPLWGTTPGTQPPGGPRATDVGREVYTTTNVYLRPDPGTNNAPVGMAEAGSRVRVLNTNSNWYEVQILEHGSAQERNNLSGERGWVNKRYLNLDS
jgi:hypothetical protein